MATEEHPVVSEVQNDIVFGAVIDGDFHSIYHLKSLMDESFEFLHLFQEDMTLIAQGSPTPQTLDMDKPNSVRLGTIPTAAISG